MIKENIQIKSECDKLPLDVLILIPENEIKGIIQFSHGMSEYKNKYIKFMEYLTQKGYVTVIHDQRGHGKSIRNKEDLGYFYDEKAEFVVEDLKQITLYIKNRFPNKKLVLFGHSMGSMIVRKFIKKYDDEINGLIVCGSPSRNSKVDLGILTVKILKIFFGDKHRSKFVNRLTFGKSTKPKDDTNQDELTGFIFTLNGFQNVFTLMKDIYSKEGWLIKNKNLPILFIAGSDDSIIKDKERWIESQDFLKNLGYDNIQNKLYDGLKHELINSGQQEVWEDIYNFAEKIKNKT